MNGSTFAHATGGSAKQSSPRFNDSSIFTASNDSRQVSNKRQDFQSFDSVGGHTGIPNLTYNASGDDTQAGTKTDTTMNFSYETSAFWRIASRDANSRVKEPESPRHRRQSRTFTCTRSCRWSSRMTAARTRPRPTRRAALPLPPVRPLRVPAVRASTRRCRWSRSCSATPGCHFRSSTRPRRPAECP
jgi:hypothetical protein